MYIKEEQAAHRALWIAALRSGEYKQGSFWLRASASITEKERPSETPPDRTRDKFCCLGVACDISGIGEWFHTDDSTSPHFFYDCGKNQTFGGASTLPGKVQEWLGVPSENGQYVKQWSPQTIYDSLSGLNDRDEKTFDEIADAIEAIDADDWYDDKDDKEVSWRLS